MAHRVPIKRLKVKYPACGDSLIRDIHAQGGHRGGRTRETYRGGDNGQTADFGPMYVGIWCNVCGAQLARLLA